MQTVMTVERERAIVAGLLHGHTVGHVAATTGVSMRQIEAVAAAAGYPNTERLEQRLVALAPAHDLDPDDGRTSTTTSASTAEGPELRELILVDPNDLYPDPNNPRDELDGIEELAASIEQVGLLQPIVARQSGAHLVIVAGHRRHAAVLRLGLPKVEVVLGARPLASDEVLVRMLIENGQRSGLDPIEEARALNRIKQQQGLNSSSLAKMVGRAQSYVDGRLSLLALPPELQAKVRIGQLGIVAAVNAARRTAGTKRPSRDTHIAHLSELHPLASRVRAKCRMEGHNTFKVGKVGCGSCWEAVIRAAVMRELADALAQSGTCPTCGRIDSHGLASADVAFGAGGSL